MSHDLDFSTGAAAMAYVGARPWHGLGEALPEGQSIDTWLEAARLRWKLERLPVQYLVDGELHTMTDRYVLARDDTRAALSVVSGDYEIVQPREVLEFFRDLVADHGYTLETAGALDGGRKFWALARTGRKSAVGYDGQDHLAAYVLLATSCDKSLATTAAFTSVRVVCQNTLGFAMSDVQQNRRRNVKVTHSRRFDQKEVHEALGLLDSAWDRFMTGVRAMAARSINDAEADDYFRRVLLRTPGVKAADAASEHELPPRAERERQTLKALFHSAPGSQLLTAKKRLWGAVNAVTYYVDHVRSAGAGDRLDSAWFGSGQTLKQAAWDEAQALLETHHSQA